MVEGEGSREFHKARAMARRDPDAFGKLIDLVADATTAHLIAQIEAGAQVVQLFDSWAGVLPEPGVRNAGASRRRCAWSRRSRQPIRRYR